jgi:hypothetical protein
MLAKLFDDIGIASLIRSLTLALVLLILVFFVSGGESVSLRVLHLSWSLPGALAALIGAPLLMLSVVWFNSAINSIPLLKRDYQLSIVTSILLIPVLITQGSLNLILLLPLVVLFLVKQLALGENPEISYLLFDSGTIIGIMLFFEPLSWVFLLILWLGLINYGHFGLKQLLMPVLGLLAIWFLGCSIIYWSAGSDEVLAALQASLVFPAGKIPRWSENLWRVLPVAILVLPAFFELLATYGKAKVLQRQSFGLLMILFVILLVAGSIFYDPAGLWFWMAFPAAVIIVNLINGLKRSWLKDLVYLVLICYLLLFLL